MKFSDNPETSGMPIWGLWGPFQDLEVSVVDLKYVSYHYTVLRSTLFQASAFLKTMWCLLPGFAGNQ